MARKVQFTDRELDLMSILWKLGIGNRERGPAASPARLGYTSVLRILQVLEAKGHVRHEPEGRAYRYFPTVDPEVAGRRALGKIVDKIFHGPAELTVASLVEERPISPEELERMRRILDEIEERSRGEGES